jgi:hypothetical protein
VGITDAAGKPVLDSQAIELCAAKVLRLYPFLFFFQRKLKTNPTGV